MSLPNRTPVAACHAALDSKGEDLTVIGSRNI
jgi:hypothetical protein